MTDVTRDHVAADSGLITPAVSTTGSCTGRGEYPFVTVVVPCLNEERFIQRCLDSVLANRYPNDRMEILVIDGMSTDHTRAIARGFADRHPCVRVLDNPRRSTPAGLNVGIRHAKGDVILRIDAHCVYPPNYIRDLIQWLDTSGADNVGGVCVTLPASATAKAEAIATALSSSFGVGNSYFRIGTSRPRWVDTVPFGCYRREVFERIGTFDEDLPRNQDDEFNSRLIRRGGRILLVPDVSSNYYARESLGGLRQMFYQYGYFKPLAAWKVGAVLTVRQLVPAAFVATVLATGALAVFSPASRALALVIIGAYLAANLTASAAAARRGRWRTLLYLPATFAVMHLSYGVGFLLGAIDFLLLRRRPVSRLPISRP